jgi:hypothetical protein
MRLSTQRDETRERLGLLLDYGTMYGPRREHLCPYIF